MAPKRKVKAQDEAFIDDDDNDVVELESDEDTKPKKKAKKPAPKKKSAAKEEGDGDEPPAKKKPAKPAAPKVPKITEPTTGTDGWTLHPPSLVYKVYDNKGATKIGAFDFDGTLCTFKDPKRKFAMGSDDWRLYNATVPAKIQQLRDEGYTIVVFSNQGAIKSALAGKASENTRSRFQQVFDAIGGPIAAAFMSTSKDEFRKPEKGMWEFFTANCNGGVKVDLEGSFFCGDAAGNPGDALDTPSDRDFATAAGLPFKTPKEVFGESGGGSGAAPNATGVNADLANVFQQLADRFSDDTFKARAFKNAAGVLQDHPDRITSGKQALKLPKIGKGSAAYIDEFLTTGKLEALDTEIIEKQKAATAEAAKKDAEKKSGSAAFAFL
mmetsp:Transcript_17876/g.53806  ORF Transcript_17876/g.53806 Transcript_17876/m.53806 type:complete len:382 (-) Transcript_17876:1549-2694(-)